MHKTDKHTPKFDIGDHVTVTCRGKTQQMEIEAVIHPGQWGSNEKFTTAGMRYMCGNGQDHGVFAQECLQKIP